MLQREHGSGGAVLDGGARLLAVKREVDALRAHDERLHSHLTAMRGKVGHNGRNLDGHRAVCGKGKVSSRYNMQRNIAVNAAIEGKVRLLRVDRVIVAVVHRDGQYIVAGAQGVGNVHAEGGVAALVLCQLLSVQTDHGGHGHAVKLQHGAPARRELRRG